MIKLEFENKIFTINDDYKLSPSNENIEKSLQDAINTYNSPAQGFKTGYIAEQLSNSGIKILDIFDKELEDTPDGIVY